jgi:hypothetical protein
MSKAAFAGIAGVPKVSFYYWCKKFGFKPEPMELQSIFTRIGLSTATPPVAMVKISYSTKISLELFDFLDADTIKALLLRCWHCQAPLDTL